MHKLPYNMNVETEEIMKLICQANLKLGELNGMILTLPNPKMILNATILAESKESAAIENIVTTYDNIFKQLVLNGNDDAAKEVINYRAAILNGLTQIKKDEFISINTINTLHSIICPGVGSVRKVPGTVLKNSKTGEIVHTPPQSESEILDYLTNLEKFINEEDNLDPLIKMAIMHYQFETIHPYHDGNGRTGRALNVLYLTLSNRLVLPILYISRYINKNRQEYYGHFAAVQKDITNLNDYIIFMIKGIIETAHSTIEIIRVINNLIEQANNEVRMLAPKIYDKNMINYLFYDFYTKNEYFRDALGISRNTAAKYLKELAEIGILTPEKIGKETIYKNNYLFAVISKWQ